MKKSPATRKTPSGRKSTAKTASRKPGAKKSAPGGMYVALPSGYTRSPNSAVIVPVTRKKAVPEPGIVPASKLQSGISKARDQITGVLQELVDAARENYEITEIELSASFSADGKFLGFGVGGEMSIKFKIRPTDEA